MEAAAKEKERRELEKERKRKAAAKKGPKVVNKDGVDMRVPDSELADSARQTDFVPKPMGRGR